MVSGSLDLAGMVSPARIRRLRALARLLLAGAGGYALAAAGAMALARGLPGSRVEAAIWGALAAVLLMPAAAIWAYAAPRLWQAAAGIVGVIAVLAVIAVLLGQPA